MIDVYTWTTGNSRKIPIFLEETALPYRLHMVDIHKGEFSISASAAFGVSPSSPMSRSCVPGSIAPLEEKSSLSRSSGAVGGPVEPKRSSVMP